MQIRTVKTHKITEADTEIFAILDRYITHIEEHSVVAITSKIISICEGSMVKFNKATKDELVVQESDYYIPREENIFRYLITITRNLLIPAAGIDESNANDHYILLPKDAQKTANAIRRYLVKRFSVKHVGVVITDSKTTPFRWGSTGIGLAHSGFAALNDYRNTPDLFGREMKITQANVMDALAASAVLIMGEGIEQTPLAIITDVPFINFQKRNPTLKELAILYPPLNQDLYSSIIMKAAWRKGKRHDAIR
jgi:putative folate metabolism gamma-glutamate ligase